VRARVVPAESEGSNFYYLRFSPESRIERGDRLKLTSPQDSPAKLDTNVSGGGWAIPVNVGLKTAALFLDSVWGFKLEVGFLNQGNLRVDFMNTSNSGVISTYHYDVKTSHFDFSYIMFGNRRF